MKGLIVHEVRSATILTLVIGMALIPSGTPVARGDSFAIPLGPPVIGKLPTVVVGGAGGKTVTLSIDSGAGVTQLTPAAAQTLGIDPTTGTPGTLGGIGGAEPAENNVPAGNLNPTGSSAPVTPPGQKNTSPPLPATVTVANFPAGGGLLGNDYLFKYNMGIIDTGPGPVGHGQFLVLGAKDEGQAGYQNAVKLAFQDSNLPPPNTPDGRPPGTQTQPITPTSFPTTVINGGYNLNLNISNSAMGLSQSGPFLIESGLPTTLITTALAQALGLNTATLPQVQTFGNFGPITVPEATLQIQLFNNPSFDFSVPVGITNSTINPLGINILGDDILSQLPYWEISTTTGTPQFYAALSLTAVPEPSGIVLLGLGILGVLVHARRRRNPGHPRSPE